MLDDFSNDAALVIKGQIKCPCCSYEVILVNYMVDKSWYYCDGCEMKFDKKKES